MNRIAILIVLPLMLFLLFSCSTTSTVIQPNDPLSQQTESTESDKDIEIWNTENYASLESSIETVGDDVDKIDNLLDSLLILFNKENIIPNNYFRNLLIQYRVLLEKRYNILGFEAANYIWSKKKNWLYGYYFTETWLLKNSDNKNFLKGSFPESFLRVDSLYAVILSEITKEDYINESFSKLHRYLEQWNEALQGEVLAWKSKKPLDNTSSHSPLVKFTGGMKPNPIPLADRVAIIKEYFVRICEKWKTQDANEIRLYLGLPINQYLSGLIESAKNKNSLLVKWGIGTEKNSNSIALSHVLNRISYDNFNIQAYFYLEKAFNGWERLFSNENEYFLASENPKWYITATESERFNLLTAANLTENKNDLINEILLLTNKISKEFSEATKGRSLRDAKEKTTDGEKLEYSLNERLVWRYYAETVIIPLAASVNSLEKNIGLNQTPCPIFLSYDPGSALEVLLTGIVKNSGESANTKIHEGLKRPVPEEIKNSLRLIATPWAMEYFNLTIEGKLSLLMFFGREATANEDDIVSAAIIKDCYNEFMSSYDNLKKRWSYLKKRVEIKTEKSPKGDEDNKIKTQYERGLKNIKEKLCHHCKQSYWFTKYISDTAQGNRSILEQIQEKDLRPFSREGIRRLGEKYNIEIQTYCFDRQS